MRKFGSKEFSRFYSAKHVAWVNTFKYNFHRIGDFAKVLLNTETLANNEDKVNALLGIRCHQRGFEPFFPSTAFISGKLYDYSRSKDTNNKNNDHENKSFETCKDNKTKK